jgi:serine/threonine protein phosphatase 1
MFATLRQFFSPPTALPQMPPVFSIPSGIRVYAVGDIHGRKHLLSDMLSAIENDARAHPDKRIIEVFLGDYVDRGFHSKEVIDLLLAPSANGHERICLVGNHEEVLLQFLNDPKVMRDWANFGGYATLASYGVVIPPSMSPEKLSIMRDAFKRSLPAQHLQFLNNLQMSYSLGNYLFVHAGILPNLPLDQQKPEYFLWIRDRFLKHTDFFEHYVVHGHSPVAKPDILLNRANLDISAASIPSLCCLVIEGRERTVLTVQNQRD